MRNPFNAWTRLPLICLGLASIGLAGCGPEQPEQSAEPTLQWAEMQDASTRVLSITGLSGPEAVRYDPDQDVYFIANFNGDSGSRDGNGFISRVRAEDGHVETQQFMVGTEQAPLHAPRGMMLVDNTLWVADIDGIHGFNRTDGSHVAFIDFSAFEPGFLNDVAAGPDGTLYVSDTGRSRIYRVDGDTVSIAVEGEAIGPPNGITWAPGEPYLRIAPWAGGGGIIRGWNPSDGTVTELTASIGDRVDGIEVMGTTVVAAVQSDSSIYAVHDGQIFRAIQVEGRPADIAIDTRRSRVAVPYIALNRVDIWALPQTP
ncbi:MAG: hypothetical protein RIE53_01970 [Rhodothermales bacterium]